MFDTIMGLPVHILVIHAVVVLGPIAALMAMAYAARPAWRAALKWPLVVGALATGVTGLVAGESGEQLEARVRAADAGDAAALALVHDHAEAGDLTKVLCLVFMVVVLAAVFWAIPATGRARAGAVNLLAVAAVVLASLAAMGSITWTGHTGAKAAWADQITATSAGTAHN
ncbi:MAG: hypothetical protein IPH03_02665 [Tetrasphaera sp.]|jgi:hypothetical protein|nr:hypothetical protein [Tetrasphaera sp.]